MKSLLSNVVTFMNQPKPNTQDTLDQIKELIKQRDSLNSEINITKSMLSNQEHEFKSLDIEIAERLQSIDLEDAKIRMPNERTVSLKLETFCSSSKDTIDEKVLKQHFIKQGNEDLIREEFTVSLTHSQMTSVQSLMSYLDHNGHGYKLKEYVNPAQRNAELKKQLLAGNKLPKGIGARLITRAKISG